MNLSIKNAIYQAIMQNKWLSVTYVNTKKVSTSFYIAVNDIDIKKGNIVCDIFNPFKSNSTLENGHKDTFIKIDGIQSAFILEHSYYEAPRDLIKKCFSDSEIEEFLDVVNFDNNILKYLSECYRLDNDPYIKEYVMVDGIDLHTLSNSTNYKLSDKQFEHFLNTIFKVPYFEAEKMNKFRTLAINKLSIDMNGKPYCVAYKVLTLNFKNKTLKVSEETRINKSFLLNEGKRVSLASYLDISANVFEETFEEKVDEYTEMIKDNFRFGELINTRPTIFFLERPNTRPVEEALDAIYKMDKSNTLTFPLKCFFGKNRKLSARNPDIDIVVFDKKKINIDQLRVVYNSLVNHVTYVKGPPGTGKTETIFNVILSAFLNNKKVLVCSNNNHPVDDIYEKMNKSFTKNGVNNFAKKFIFPMVRIGNRGETLNAIKFIREVFKFVEENKKAVVFENITEKSKTKSLTNFKELKRMITEYETFITMNENSKNLKKIRELIDIDQMANKLDEIISEKDKQIKQASNVSSEAVLDCAFSVNEDYNFKNYLYFSTLIRYKKLLSDRFNDLKEILEIEDNETCVSRFNGYLRDNDNLKKLLDIFPIIICTNLSCDKLGDASPHFDMCIMDESGQCNIASALIPIVRSKDLLLVGDTNQLQPVTVLEDFINLDLIKKYGVNEKYNYVKNSILSTMLSKDNNSKTILLSYHYRCANKIAKFVNDRYYEQQLKLLNEKEGSLIYCNVKNTGATRERNSYYEEANAIVNLIQENNYQDVGIITPFVNQANLINYLLKVKGIENIKAGTIHTLQGSEKSIIIMSAALSLKSGKKTMDWIKNNHELINVGVTRAKDKFIFVGDKEAIDTLSGTEQSDIKVLSDYVYSNGKITVPKSDNILSLDFSNNSINEKEFFKTVKPYFNRRGSKFRIERNVPVVKAIKKVEESDLKIIGKKEFDLIVQSSHGFIGKQFRTIVVFEVDGGEHVGSKRTAMLDRQKEEVCKKYGIKMIRIANSQVKDYESIIALFECVVKGLPSLEDATVQMSLFEESEQESLIEQS